MSKVVKGIKKGVKKVGKFVKKHWKPIVGAALVAFTGGLAIGGLGNFSSMVGSKGLFTTVASTMKAGVTGIAGTFGIGSGAAGTYAGLAGAKGATLLTGAGAQALGLASAGAGAGAGAAAANVGTYIGPGSSFLGGGGSLFGGAAGVPVNAAQPIANHLAVQGAGQGGGSALSATMNAGTRAGLAQGAGQATGSSLLTAATNPAAAAGLGWKGAALTAAVPSLINMGAGYFGARAEEEDAAAQRARERYGPIDYDNGMGVYAQNWDSPYGGYITPDGEHRGYNTGYYQPDGQGGLMDVRYAGAV